MSIDDNKAVVTRRSLHPQRATVKTHLNTLFCKLHLRHRVHAVVLASEVASCARTKSPSREHLTTCQNDAAWERRHRAYFSKRHVRTLFAGDRFVLGRGAASGALWMYARPLTRRRAG